MADDAAAASPRAHAEAPLSPEPAASVAESFIGLMRTVRRSKARLLDAAGRDVDSASQVLLHTLAAEGPMRASALASSVQADLSTVSRQVTALVGHGLLERQADQHDGRATLLAVTSAGRDAVARHEQNRQAFFEAVLSGWTPAEMRQFAQQLERFTAAYDHVHAAWISERAPRQDETGGHARSTDPQHPAASEQTELEEGSHA
jgi:DNA-binding MarR family transcriptional regulator